MMNALRLSNGFSSALFEQTTQLNITSIENTLNKHQQLGLISNKNGHITPTTRGKQMLDSMLQDYLVDV